MPNQTFLKILLFLAIGCFFTTNAMSQRKLEMNDSTGLHSYTLVRGDEAHIVYDSAFLLNKKIYYLYKENYNKARNANPAIKMLLEEYEKLINYQDSMLREKNQYYILLKASFDDLVKNTNGFVDRTDKNAAAIDQSLSNATAEINNIKLLIASSLDKLKLQQKQKVKLFLGGLAVGIGVTSLVFLIAK
jgi:hypothetical protein